MKFIDNVENAETPTVADINAALAGVTLEGDWTILRYSHLVSAHEAKTQEIHFFISNVPAEMAQEILVRDREVFHPVGDVWS